MKILITGGAGFIGSNLCEYLISKNFHVTVLDNLETGNIDNLKQVKKSSFIKLIYQKNKILKIAF